MPTATATNAFQKISSFDVAINMFDNVRNLADICLHLDAGNDELKSLWHDRSDALIEIYDDLRDSSTEARHLGRDYLLGVVSVLDTVDMALRVTKARLGTSKNSRLADGVLGRARMYALRLLDVSALQSPASTRDATAPARLTQAETIAMIRASGIAYLRTKEGLHRVDYRRNDPRRRVEIMPTAFEGDDLAEAVSIAQRMCKHSMQLHPVTRAKGFLSLAAIAIETANATA